MPNVVLNLQVSNVKASDNRISFNISDDHYFAMFHVERYAFEKWAQAHSKVSEPSEPGCEAALVSYLTRNDSAAYEVKSVLELQALFSTIELHTGVTLDKFQCSCIQTKINAHTLSAVMAATSARAEDLVV